MRGPNSPCPALAPGNSPADHHHHLFVPRLFLSFRHMNLQGEYWDHVAELRDAGRRLMKVFDDLGRHSRDRYVKNQLQKDLREAKVCVLELEELLQKRG